MSGLRSAIFYHRHPYKIFIPEGTRKVIVGTLPPPRFSIGQLKTRDVDFCYGSCDGMLWPILEAIFHLSFRYDNSAEAVRQRQEFLRRQRLGICDIVESCRREKINASDLGMTDIRLRNIVEQIELHSSIETLVLTGGNTRNGPEFLLRRLLRAHGLQLRCVVRETPREHRFSLGDRVISTVSLTSPSNAANMAIGGNPLYKQRKKDNPAYSTVDYRIDQYKKIFLDEE